MRGQSPRSEWNNTRSATRARHLYLRHVKFRHSVKRSPDRSPAAIKAVTLDCWGTLVVDGPASDDRYQGERLVGIQRILAASGVKTGRRDLDRAYLESGRRLARIWRERRDVPIRRHVEALLRALNRDLLERLHPRIMDELIDAYASPALRAPPAIDDGAAASLAALVARGLILGLVSNTMRTPGVVFRQIFDRLALLAPFTVVTFSDECGVRKPDPEIFFLTVRQMGVSPGEVIHVGDDPILDVEGARSAQLGGVIQVAADDRAIWPVEPDAVITGLDQLPAALDRLVSS
ncbi:MAG: hypothetical protein C5B48_14450 [Candidatus Rokuibacteriota bacterium]|nr:MAG: hypothetical protein C5B48_14450 [Candidatus Rokubacteria bacterium]